MSLGGTVYWSSALSDPLDEAISDQRRPRRASIAGNVVDGTAMHMQDTQSSKSRQSSQDIEGIARDSWCGIGEAEFPSEEWLSYGSFKPTLCARHPRYTIKDTAIPKATGKTASSGHRAVFEFHLKHDKSVALEPACALLFQSLALTFSLSRPEMTHSITIREANFSGNLMTACGAALIGYDYLLTLKRESRFFWKRKPEIAISSILFFVNRYLALFYYVGLGLAYFRCQSSPLSQESCRTQYYIDIATRYLQYLPWAVFSTLRVYALSRKNWFWSALTFLLSILPIPFDFYADFHNVSFDGKLVFGCRSWALTSSLGNIDTAVIRGGQIIADAIVIGVTWKATSYAPRGRSASLSLATVMFRNGTLYFVVLLTMNILHIIFTFLPRSFLHSSLLNASYVTKLSEPITTVLISRFMLDLHQSNTGTAQGNLSAGSDIRSSFGSTGAGGIAGGVDPEDWLINSVERSDIDFDDAWSMQRLHHGDSLDGVAAPIGSK